MSDNRTISSADSDDDLTFKLRQYLNKSHILRSEEPIKYWDKLKVVYPTLHSCALKYLCIVATSVPSERMFSKAVAIKAECRSRLTGYRLNDPCRNVVVGSQLTNRFRSGFVRDSPNRDFVWESRWIPIWKWRWNLQNRFYSKAYALQLLRMLGML